MMPYRNLPMNRKQILAIIDNKNDFLLLNIKSAYQGQNSLNTENLSAEEGIVRPAALDYFGITISEKTSASTNPAYIHNLSNDGSI